MGFIVSSHYEEGISDWSGNWLSLSEFSRNFSDVWAEISAVKNMPEKTLKSAVSSSLTGKSGVERLFIEGNNLTALISGREYSGKVNFLEKRRLFIRRSGKKFNITYEDGTVLYSYYSFQSKYSDESEYGLYIYETEGLPWKFVSLTEVDRGTENTDGSSFHICFTDDIRKIMQKGEICTFALDDGSIPGVLRAMYGL